MNPIESYFDRIFVIHQPHRVDRMAHMREQWAKYGFTKMEVFEAYSGVMDHLGHLNGNAGCTASHRALFEIIAFNRWNKVAIFEDDFEFVGDDPMGQFESTIKQVPPWDVLYMAGHYAEPPIARVGPNVIRCGRMHTTSSYAVRWQTARKIAPYLCGVGPIDTLISGFLPSMQAMILDPRIAVQYASFSDLTERESNNAPCMLDMNHSSMV